MKRVHSWQVDWENIDWSKIKTGSSEDPNMYVIWPLKLIPTEKILAECKQRMAKEKYLADFGRRMEQLRGRHV